MELHSNALCRLFNWTACIHTYIHTHANTHRRTATVVLNETALLLNLPGRGKPGCYVSHTVFSEQINGVFTVDTYLFYFALCVSWEENCKLCVCWKENSVSFTKLFKAVPTNHVRKAYRVLEMILPIPDLANRWGYELLTPWCRDFRYLATAFTESKFSLSCSQVPFI